MIGTIHTVIRVETPEEEERLKLAAMKCDALLKCTHRETGHAVWRVSWAHWPAGIVCLPGTLILFYETLSSIPKNNASERTRPTLE